MKDPNTINPVTFFHDWSGNYLTPAGIAKAYGISPGDASKLIDQGRELIYTDQGLQIDGTSLCCGADVKFGLCQECKEHV